MKRLVDLVKLDRLDNLIRLKATGCPDDLAKRMEMSRASLFELIAYLRDKLDAPIKYNEFNISYEYRYPTKFHLGFERDRFNETSMEIVSGGIEDNHKFNKTPDNEKPDDELEQNKKDVL